ncbi:hypothetical protein [Streptomyces cylindrosporus]|uniref:Uncharacterized protein n=1 Tax=Streptomyces cylindrosporus TaxID=2927583 RepID=A0ABS9YKE9_9ACTN|nr:hypothetical protein [Streptomyces cylindrosporus]MCI3277669.1 hypothetical protein [Streptomyces cylindrosporus]
MGHRRLQLGCGRDDLPVIYLGPVQWDGQHAPSHACSDCLARLMRQATTYFRQRQPAAAALSTRPARACPGVRAGRAPHPRGGLT